jgi:hypothetical protein
MSVRSNVQQRWLAVALALGLGFGSLVGTAAADTVEQVPRTYRAAVVAPASGCVAPGVPTRVEVRLTNTSTQQRLGSADVRLPSGLVADTSVAARPTVVVSPVDTSARPTATLVGGTIRLRELAAAPLSTVDVAFTLTAAAGSHTITTVAKQANNFSGPPGNDLALVGPAPTITTEDCLRLRFRTQPGDSERDQPIPWASTAGAPQVDVTDATGTPVTVAGLTVSIALGTDPTGSDPLSGTRTVATGADGVATFEDLRISRSAEGYTLVASAPGYTSVTSTPFDVYDDLCAAGERCETSAGDLATDQLRTTASGTAGPGGSGLTVSVQPPVAGSGGCAPPPSGEQYTPLPTDVTLSGTPGMVDKTATIRVDKAYDQAAAQNGAAHYQICARPEEPTSVYSVFLDRYTGQPVEVGQWGYLPDCGAIAVPTVCVVSRTKNAGDALITVFWGSKFTIR